VIRVVLADDQPLVRAALAILLNHEPDIDVVGEAEDGEQAIAMARELVPDVVLMDVRMPVLDGIDATAQIASDPALARTRILVLTTFEDEETVGRALRSGASGFIGKGAEPAELARAIRTVHSGDALLSPAATKAVIERYVRGRADAGSGRPAELAALTDREIAVLAEVGRGRTNDQIAEALGISAMTVKTHVNRAMTKLKVHDRSQLVVIAYSTGLVR